MSRRDWVLLAGLSVSETVSWGILYYTFAVLLQPMEAELGWSRAETTGAFSLGLLTSALAAPLVGRWIDRRGPRLLMTAGSCAGALLLVLWSRVETLGGLYFVWAGIGVVMAAVLYEPAFAVVATWFSRERDRALAALTLVAGLASAIFVPLTSELTQRLGWRTALVVLAAVLAGITIPIHASLVRGPSVEATHGAGVSTVAPRDAPLGVALRSPAFRSLAVAFVIGGLTSSAMAVHLIPYLTERGHSAHASAAAMGMVGAMQLPGRLLFGPLSQRVPPSWMPPLVFACMTVALAAASLVPGGAGLAVFVVCFGIGNGMMTLTRAATVANVFGTARYGSISGALAGLTTSARAAGPIAAAVAHEAFGAYAPVLGILAVSLTIGACWSIRDGLELEPRAPRRSPWLCGSRGAGTPQEAGTNLPLAPLADATKETLRRLARDVHICRGSRRRW